MVSSKAKELIRKIMTMVPSDIGFLHLAVEEQEFLKTASKEDLDYYVQYGAGECLYMCVSGILLEKPELAKQFPDLDIKRYQPIVR